MSKMTQLHNPATGEKLEPFKNDDVSVVRPAIERARAAQAAWAEKSFKERGKYLKKIKAFLADNAERACTIISNSTGKLRQDALVTEVMPCLLACDWYASNAQKILKDKKVGMGSIVFANKSNKLIHVPVGVVGIISPWNYPFSLPFGEILMALMAGNAVILKVATHTTHVGFFIDECMRAAGLPKDLYQHLVVSGAAIGPALLEAGIDKLFFTGSVPVGKQLADLAAKTLTPLVLELGGNDPMIVCDDASIERAVNCACWAGYQNAGQSCGGVQRIYAQQGIYDEFVRQLNAKTRALRHGPETGDHSVDMGALTTKSQLETVKAMVDEAVKDGAVISAQSRPVGDCSKGYFYPATVLLQCRQNMRIIQEELFGPVMMVIPFLTDQEALRMANDSKLALTSSVFSTSSKRIKFFTQRLETGVVTVDDHLYTHGMCETPWGGWKESGLGRTHGELGLKEMVNVKCINSDCLPASWVPRNLWWFPFSEKTYSVMAAAMRLVSTSSCCQWASSLCYLICNTSYMFKTWAVGDARPNGHEPVVAHQD